MTNHRSVFSAALAAACLWTALVAATPAWGQVSIGAGGDVEARIDVALTQRVSLEVVDSPLRDVLQVIARQTGITIRLSKKIEDAGVQPDQPVTISARDVSAEALLSLLLRELNLAFMFKHEALVVTTSEDSQSPENMVTRVYPVADLVDLIRIPASQGGGIEMDFDPIIDMITSTIEPDSWQDVGGAGSITGFENSRSLVVSNRREIHHRIAATIVTLRRAKGLQGIRAYESRGDSGSPRATAALQLSAPLPVPSREKPAQLRIRVAPAIEPSPPSVGGLF